MNFDLDDDQRMLAGTARDWFEAHAGPDRLRASLDTGAPIAPGRAGLAEMGFLGIVVPEDAGGSGQSVLDLAVVAEQAGRALAGPSLAGAGRAAVLLAAAKAGELQAGLASGEAAIAVLDGDLTLTGGSGSDAVSGDSHPCLDAVDATTYLALAGDALVAVPAGERAKVRAGEPLDPSRGLAGVCFDGAAAQVLLRGAQASAAWARARQVGAVVLGAEDLGSADQCVAMSVDYAKVRTAFGRPIGSFQAVKHACVDMFVDVEQLRSLVWYAAWAADADPKALPLAASAVKAFAADAFERAAASLIQVHGGIGFTWEHAAHLYWRRAKVDRLLLGDAAEHRDAVARLALAGAVA